MPSSTKPAIPAVYYHSIGPATPGWARNYLTLELPFFEDQLKYYKRNFTVITLKQYYLIRAGSGEAPQNPLAITFDDGYLDNWVWAFPLLKKLGLPATIFVSPEMVDPRNLVRPNLENYWSGDCSLEELNQAGHLSWEEMRQMEASGLIDIQSHTMTHTKYFISDELRDFHHPGADALYPIGNLFAEEKPFHIANPSFEKLLPYGYPFFEEASSIIARKVDINPAFVEECTTTLSDYDFSRYQFTEARQKILPIWKKFQEGGALVLAKETEAAYQERVRYEVTESKRAIEEQLGKKVEFLCWPHGDCTPDAHQIAMEAGYLATTAGHEKNVPECLERIPRRIGIFQVRSNRLLSLLKARYKIGRYLGSSPWKEVSRLYQFIRRRRA